MTTLAWPHVPRLIPKTTHIHVTIHRRARLLCWAESLPSDGATKKTSQDEIMARLAKAREYKSKSQEAPPASASQPEPEPAGDAILERLGEYATKLASQDSKTFLLAQREISDSAAPSSAPSAANSPERDNRRGAGDASEAANWLQTVSTQGLSAQVDQNLRAEEFTMRKEELQREQGATIERARGIIGGTKRTKYSDDGYGLAQQQDEAEASIAAERLASAAGSEAAASSILPGTAENDGKDGEVADPEDKLHKPKVATWGVYPRPRNISEAYGGGRNLKPGQELESEVDEMARKQRVSDALAKYRKKMGLEIDPAVEAEALALFKEGQALFKGGHISAALDKFTASAKLVPLRSKIGGQVFLQKAICLDSVGRNEEAYDIYTRLKGHNAPGVSKASRRMLFGFKAAKNLKVETMRYDGGGTQAWKQYFDRIGSGAWVAYTASEQESEEDKQAARNAALIAALVVLTPLVFVGALIVR